MHGTTARILIIIGFLGLLPAIAVSLGLRQEPPQGRIASNGDPANSILPSENDHLHELQQMVAVSSRIRQIRYALEQVGAQYILLETLHQEPDRYRFYCEIPISQDSIYLRPIEVTASDPLTAIETGWRMAQHPKATEVRQAEPLNNPHLLR